VGAGVGVSAVLEVADLRVTYPSRAGAPFEALKGVSFVIPEGGTFGLVGESGSGKTTAARAVLGLVPVTAGTIRLGGANLGERRRCDARGVAAQVQAVFQDPYSSLNPSFSIGTSMSRAIAQRHPGARRADLRGIAAAQLERVGLSAALLARRPRELSGGQRQRVCIARALAVEPQLLVCDEPTSALDLTARAQIVNLLIELQRERSFSMLFITHDLALCRYLCDDIAVIHRGEIVEGGPPSRTFEAPQDPYTRRLVAAIPDVSAAFAAVDPNLATNLVNRT